MNDLPGHDRPPPSPSASSAPSPEACSSSMFKHLEKKLYEFWLPVINRHRLPIFLRSRANSPDGPPRPQTTPRGAWRPMALRPVFLSLITTIMFAMLITLEVLRRYCDQYGGLVFFSDTDDLSNMQSFAYNYVPIIAALALVTLWTFIDYDVLRLEPYFQIARPEGAPASVLFINYNFGQSFLTPLTSARRHHWIVLLVSVTTMLVRMFLPALQSTLLELREINILDDDEMQTWPKLLDLDHQAGWMFSQESNPNTTLASVLTTNTQLRDSRSSSYAVAPVEISLEDRQENTVWTLNETIYWAQLSCGDVMIDNHLSVSVNDNSTYPPAVSWNVTDVKLPDLNGTDHGCILDFHYKNIYFDNTDYLQIRYWEPVWPNRSYHSPDLSSAFTARGCENPYDLYGIVLSVNATEVGAYSISEMGSDFTSSATIFACKIDYRQATARLSMHANSSITNVTVFAETETALSDQTFNIHAFQGLLAQRAPYTGDMLFIENNQTSGDTTVTELPVISQNVRDLEPLLVLDASTIMTPDEFETKVTRGVIQTFVLTFARLFNPDQEPTSVPALRFSTQVTISVVAFAAWCSEIMLAFGIVLTVCLIYFYQSRPNILQSDPGSIGAMCSMLTDVFGPTNILADPQTEFHQFSTRQLRQILDNCRLQWQQGPEGPRLGIVTADGSPVTLPYQTRTRVDPMPHFLVVPIFIVEFLFLAAIITTMGLTVASLAHDGSFQHLTQHGSSFLQVVLSFLPSVVASSVGALCNSILRNISILEPWVHLQRGMATAQSSLSLNYGSQNPWAVFRKAVQDRHVLLGLVSFTCIANVVLTIVAGGLFTQQLTASSLPSKSLYANYSQSHFRQTEFAADFTEFDLIQTSVTSGVPLLSWMAANYSFLPIRNTSPNPDVLYGATTLGIGAELDCVPLSVKESMRQTGNTQYWVYHPFNNATRECTVNMTGLARPHEAIALSIHFLSPSSHSDRDQCQESTFLVVGRWNYTAGSTFTSDNTIALHCEPKVQMQNFSVTFDQRGQICDVDPIPHTSITSGTMFENATAAMGQFNKIFAAIPQSFVGEEPGRNGSYVSSYDWAGFLVARLYKQDQNHILPLQIQPLMEHSKAVYQWVYTTYFSVWRDMYLLPLKEPLPAANATVISNTWAMVPSVPSLAIALVLIALDTVMVLVVFGTRRGRFRSPRMPRSIGAIIPWIANSRMLGDFTNTYAMSSSQRREHSVRLNKRYGFRTFLQQDGRWRYAVDEEPPAIDGKPPAAEAPGPAAPPVDEAKGPEVIELQPMGEPETPPARSE
ncbi:DUF3433 domain-containing protein [Aspergillus homomorphus CBS 101889]|uniref:Uncharacterized protein n=1 Tax=Aspergillus homomorphus (strain CBS 101889) TaxID=1450537 RepID=A0A395I2I2_ASPHC|nr:hypothetical protein BO97DRAFT_387906 [Aspergillus homomorphus CBS 101889]RAL13899.1 hypothetical protein BO97DRAFT_387906 [Aspergillus homomorphus CBS 101889]